jgi:tRNA pseudouridine38-40 synthase
VNKYVAIISYDGTDFEGWQRQRHSSKTVAQTLETTFKKVFGQTIALTGASRTDAGVHALGQVVSFFLPHDIPPKALFDGWNNKLPKSVVVQSVDRASEDFHPQRNVIKKIYCYHVFTHRPLPFFARYGWFYHYPIDLDKLNECLSVFVGTHDFRSFCSGYDMKTTVRTVESINVSYVEESGAYKIEVHGPGFLRYQIRRMVGAAIEVASRPSLSVNYLEEILKNTSPRHTLPNAPAHGLVLKEIIYQKDIYHASSLPPYQ